MDQYRCDDAGRRIATARAVGTVNGVEYLEVDGGDPPGRTLLVHCLLPVPPGLGGSGLRIDGGVRADPAINPVRVEWAAAASALAAFRALPDPERVLVVRTSSAGDFSTYRLRIVDPAAHGFDPRLAEVEFGFKVDCPTDLDCLVPTVCPPDRRPEPAVDYLNRDFAGLRRLLLDRLSVVLPRWTDRTVADVGVTLVELFAYLGDHLAYAQDAVSAEAYLGTARQRTSVARHARLLDYRMHDGAAARTWLVVEGGPTTDGATLAAGTEVGGPDGQVVFHTLHDTTLRTARSTIAFHTWGDLRCCLPRGATRATLRGSCAELDLHEGDVLVLEETRGGTGERADADRAHRCAVRLSAEPVGSVDPLSGEDVVEVVWREEDALAFPLCLWVVPGRCGEPEGSAVAYGNVVLAEHGHLVGPVPVVPAEVPERGRYRPALDRTGLAHAVPYVHAQARKRPAVEALDVRPQDAVPQIVRLTDGRDDWTVRSDLLGSDRFEPDVVVETDDDGRAHLRFGDGVLGRRPVQGDLFTVSYRVGGGRAGNVGQDVLTVLTDPIPGVRVRNPMAARGGADPEPVEQVRQWAPQAFRVQQRAVTDADYATIAERDARVQRAAATRRWTGSWYTEFVTVDRRGGAPVDPTFRAELEGVLDTVRMAGVDVVVDAPVPVSLDIALAVCVEPGHVRGAVARALADRFSSRDLPGGERAFFHPDNLTFAQPVHLSAVVAAAMAVDGVRWVRTERFQRWGRPADGELAAGRIRMDRLEVARCDSDPGEPENGRIGFVLTGGV